MLRRAFLSAVAAVSLAAPAAAQTSWPLALSYVTPFATVSNTATIDIWVRLTNISTTDFLFDPSDVANGFGLDPALLPTDGVNPSTNVSAPFAQFTGAGQSAWQACDGFFGSNCTSGVYSFNFGFTPPAWAAGGTVSIAAGSWIDYIHGTYTPKGGAVPAGMYTGGPSGISIVFFGVDANGNPLEAWVDVAQTCPWGDNTCVFARDVVPEPGTYVLLATGLAGVAMVARRRSRRS